MTRASRRAPPLERDWAAARDEVIRHLQRLIQFDTTNPPGNELPLARHLEATLAHDGIETRLFEPGKDRAVVVGRIRGTGERRPLMLLAHMDVVGVERERWSVDPFAGEIRDGYVYGRGAIDDKGMLAVNLVTALLVKRWLTGSGTAPRRDLLFVATSDEEAGSRFGIGWLIANHPELADAELALNEGGRIRIVDGRMLYAAVQNAEKVSHVLRMTARGPVGHASIPLRDNALVRLGRALWIVGSHREPVSLSPTTRRFFGELSNVWPEAGEAQAMADVASLEHGRCESGAERLAALPAFDAVLRSGVSPTMVEGGVAANVIPGEVTALLNARTLPGDSPDALIERLTAAVADPAVTIRVEQRGKDAPVSDFESPMFEAIRATLAELAPGIATVPYLSTGATESAQLRAAGVQAFGLLPFPLEREDEARMHGHDERVAVTALEFGLRLVFGTVERLSR